MGSMGFGTDLIKGPVGRTLGLIVWMVVFSLFLGAINGWYLQAEAAGVVAGERFDRVVVKATADTDANDRWAAVTAAADAFALAPTAASQNLSPGNTTAYKLEEGSTAGTCKIGGVTSHVSAAGTNTTVVAQTYYTPLGTEVRSAAVTVADVDSADPANTADVTIGGCEYKGAGKIFVTGGLSGLVKILLQAAGLAPPLALLLTLGSFGSAFLRKVGSHPILAAIGMAITLLLVATLLNTFVPFLEDAFLAIDSNRFLMFDQGLGSLSVVIGNFFGVVLVAGMMMIAWEMLKSMRGGDAIGGSQRM